MRPVTWSVALLLAFAGCLGPEEGLSNVEEPEEYIPTAAAPFRVENVSDDVNDTAAADVRFTLDLEDVAFEDTLLRFALVADSPLTIEMDLAAASGWYDHRDGCYVAALTLDRPSGSAAGAFLAGWAYESSYRTGLQVMGLGTEEDPFGREGAIGEKRTLEGTFGLAQGDHVVIDIGGTDASFLRDGTYTSTGSDFHPNDLQMDFLVRGDAKIVALPSTTIRCGVGPAQGEGMAAFKLPVLQETAIDTTIGLAGEANATMLWMAEASDQRDVTLTYGDERFENPTLLFRTDRASRDMEVHYDTSSEGLPGGAWLMAETHWPFIEEAAE